MTTEKNRCSQPTQVDLTVTGRTHFFRSSQFDLTVTEKNRRCSQSTQVDLMVTERTRFPRSTHITINGNCTATRVEFHDPVDKFLALARCIMLLTLAMKDGCGQAQATHKRNDSVPKEPQAVVPPLGADEVDERKEEDRLEHHEFHLVIDGTDHYVYADFAEKLPDTAYDAAAVDSGFGPELDKDDASTPEAAALQRVLRSAAKDPNAPAHVRVTARFLSIWIGTNDIDILHVPADRPWLAEVIGAFVKDYPLTSKNCRSVTLHEAYDSVMYVFNSGDMKEVKWVLLEEET